MTRSKKIFFLSAALLTLITVFYACSSTKKNGTDGKTGKPLVLVFSKTKGFYHESIPSGVAAVQKLGQENNFDVDTTTNSELFNDENLKKYSAVVFLSTTLDVLNATQQVAFERYIQAGGGYAGVHAAADTEYDWPWYNKLVGAYFASHPNNPNVRKAVINVKDKKHGSTSFLPDRWERTDEWYNYKNIQQNLNVLAYLDETTYEGGTNGDNHPIAWYHAFDGGRAFYTGGGHTKESFSEPLFLKHLLGGILYAIGNNTPRDYSKAYSLKAPEDKRFTKTVLSNDLNEPMELTVAPDGRIFFTERWGKFYVYDPVQKKTKLLYDFPVKAVDKYKNGLIGVTLDPDFKQNNFLYVFYCSNTGQQYHQNVSRFTLTADGNLDTTSEKIVIKIPIDLEISAHTGGSLAWDKNKNLYISTGDNTVPFQSNGYAPIDEREGRQVYDAQRSSANTADLRGKILRIRPQPDGTYTIPEGNLFAPGTPGTKPEIYVMGCRNPYRISVDTATSIVYWGEIGPDAGTDSRHAPRGYDEFNQAKGPGNFGWPYFVGNNKAYHDSDFATQAIGSLFNANTPFNPSPNNTGVKTLPPAQNAMVWYPYNDSPEFPALANGGRCAMGGPMYHYNEALMSTTKLPAYYDKALFVYDWMRNWVFALRFDEASNYKRMEPFMQTNGDFRRPIDMEIGPEGSIYMLEYGSVYGIDNEDARLVRIDYNGGNRAPVAAITAKDTIGLAPLKVAFSSKKSYDYDEDDKLSYQWKFSNGFTSTEQNPTCTFTSNGIYNAVLTVTDAAGKSSTDTMEIKVGNTLPLVAINTTSNSTFFFNKRTSFDYAVAVKDNEDAAIDTKAIQVSLKYIPRVSNNTAAGHQELDADYNLGKALVASSDCKACHQLNAKSVGPSFTQVAQKYSTNKNAVGYLANKIITGGSGVWGEPAMSAHPQLSKEDASEMVKYVLSVGSKDDNKALPAAGSIHLEEHGKSTDGRYILTASYTDKGGAIKPLTNRLIMVLRPSKIQAEEADVVYNLRKNDQYLNTIHHRSYFVLKNIDLKDVDSITYRYASLNKSASIIVRTDSLKGNTISTFNFDPTGGWETFEEKTTAINNPGGKHDLYFLFQKLDTPNKHLANLDWIRFEGGKETFAQTEIVKAEQPVKKMGSVTVKKSDVKPTTALPKAVNKTTPHKGSILIANSDCSTCHTTNEKLIGPAFTAIAQRYKNNAATVNNLAGKIINGGAGSWGQIPMSPHPQISKNDAAQMVQYILSLKK